MIIPQVLSAILILLSIFAFTSRSQNQQIDDIAHHERLFQQRVRKAERTRAVLARTAGEVEQVERNLKQESTPVLQVHLRRRLESLRILFMRRTILHQRAELKQLELSEHLDLLKKGTPLTSAQSAETRRAFLSRRLQRAEAVLRDLRTGSETVISPQGKKAVSLLIQNQQALIDQLKGAAQKAGNKPGS